MKAMIFAAGRGRRLRPLTDTLPKPLVRVGSNTLIEHHIKRCVSAGFESIIINTAHLGEKIRQYLGNGAHYGIPIYYSDEGEQALETGGGIAHALPLLGSEPFVGISADIYCEIPLQSNFSLARGCLHMIMVNNPEHNPGGDFRPDEINLPNPSASSYTYSGIAYIDPALFTHEKRVFPLRDVINTCIDTGNISAELYEGVWIDVGTIGRLHQANKYAVFPDGTMYP